MSDAPIDPSQLSSVVAAVLAEQPIVDVHTHLYPPAFGTPTPNATRPTDPNGLCCWGVDELVTYHYLVAEVFRVAPATQLSYEQFWKMSRAQRADHIWKWLFVERTPISEACRGVLTALKQLGLDPAVKSLRPLRKFFAAQDPDQYIDRIMQLANVRSITMTNAVFDDNERSRWLADANVGADGRFKAALRIDPMLLDWPAAAAKMNSWGYAVDGRIGAKTIAEAQRFLRDWIRKQKAIYLAVSLPPEWRYPASGDSASERAGEAILRKVILPVCADGGLPLAMMIGVRRRANPDLRDAGDMVARADVPSVAALCRDFPANKFLVTMLARENQHELCVAARKFGNLMIFGCWWFLNTPSLIEEITRMRLELLGTSMIPQHSDARVMEQLIYKWDHSRSIHGKVLADQYRLLAEAGRRVTRAEVQRDVRLLFQDNFREFLGR